MKVTKKLSLREDWAVVPGLAMIIGGTIVSVYDFIGRRVIRTDIGNALIHLDEQVKNTLDLLKNNIIDIYNNALIDVFKSIKRIYELINATDYIKSVDHIIANLNNKNN